MIKSIFKNKKSLFNLETIKMEMKATTKEEAIQEMATLLEASNILKDKVIFLNEIYAREALSSTGFGMGIAIPHAKTKAVIESRVAVGISKDGFDFDSEDGKPVHLIFMIAAEDGSHDWHLKTLANLSRKLMNEEFVSKLKQSYSAQEVLNLLNSDKV